MYRLGKKSLCAGTTPLMSEGSLFKITMHMSHSLNSQFSLTNSIIVPCMFPIEPLLMSLDFRSYVASMTQGLSVPSKVKCVGHEWSGDVLEY